MKYSERVQPDLEQSPNASSPGSYSVILLWTVVQLRRDEKLKTDAEDYSIVNS